MKTSFSQRVLLLISIPCVFQVVIATALLLLVNRTVIEKSKFEHAQQVLAAGGSVTENLLKATRTISIAGVAGRAVSKTMIDNATDRLHENLEKLGKLTADDGENATRQYQAFRDSVELLTAYLHEMKRLLLTGQTKPAFAILIHLASLSEEAYERLERLTLPYQRVEKSSRASQSVTQAQTNYILWGSVAGNIALTALLSLYFSRNVHTRLLQVTKKTRAFAEGKPLGETIKGTDEIAELDASFHEMAYTVNTVTHALKRSEAETRDVFDSMPIAVLTVGRDGICKKLNPSARNLLEAESGSRFLEFIVDAPLPDLSTMLVAQQEILFSAVKMKRSRGSEFYGDITVAPMSGSDDQILVSIQDVTERIELELLKSEFYAMVSHDLRSPITSIMLTMQSLEAGRHGQLAESGLQKLKNQQRNCDRLLRLINDLLDAEKLESGNFDLVLDHHSVLTIINASVTSVESLCEERNITVDVSCSELLGMVCDKDRIIQVLTNLISNAIKFSPSSSRVLISAEEVDDDAVEIRVQDSGRGIPKEHLDRLFSKFHQVSTTDGARGAGTGLGLSIAKQIVEKHNGKIGVQSKMGEGSTFWFVI